MRGIESRINPKNLARTMLAISLPLAAGLSACEDSSTKSDLQPIFQPQTSSPIPEAATKNTIPYTVLCQPANLDSVELFNKSVQETVVQHGGAVIVSVEGLKCGQDKPDIVSLELTRKDAYTSVHDAARVPNITGHEDGSPEVIIFPATSCSGDYQLSSMGKIIKIRDEKTNELTSEFRLYEDCIKTIVLGPDSTNDLN